MTKGLKPIDEKKLEEAIEKHDFATAKKLISSFLDQEPSKEDKGKVYVDTVSIYIQMINHMNDSYLEQLKRTTEALEQIDAGETEIDDALKLISVKKKLVEVAEDDGFE